MTIDRHLELSVLSAPLASIDRRSLSQAWYSVLYGDRGNVARTASTNISRSAGATCTRVTRQVPCERKGRASIVGATRSVTKREAVPAFEIERRAPRSTLSRSIERVLRTRPHGHGKATFTIGATGERVQLLFRSSGSELKLVAICSPKAKPLVAAALLQARYALAQRGIMLEVARGPVVSC